MEGLDAKLISTEGDTDRWEFNMLVSSPNSSGVVADVVRDRIGSSTGSQGMFKPIPHMKGSPKLNLKSGNGSTIKWTFTDDEGRNWRGTGIVEASPDVKDKSIVTLKLART